MEMISTIAYTRLIIARWDFPELDDSWLELSGWTENDLYDLHGSYMGKRLGEFDSDELAITFVEMMIMTGFHLPWVKRPLFDGAKDA